MTEDETVPAQSPRQAAAPTEDRRADDRQWCRTCRHAQPYEVAGHRFTATFTCANVEAFGGVSIAGHQSPMRVAEDFGCRFHFPKEVHAKPAAPEDAFREACSALLVAMATNSTINDREAETLLDAMEDIDLRDGLRVSLGMFGLRGA